MTKNIRVFPYPCILEIALAHNIPYAGKSSPPVAVSLARNRRVQRGQLFQQLFSFPWPQRMIFLL